MARSRMSVIVVALVTALMASSCIYAGTWQPAIRAMAPSTPIGVSAAPLSDVECDGPEWCLAAGEVASRREGGVWTQVATPPVPVLRMSCGAVDRCLATTTLSSVVVWDGAAWSTPALPAGMQATGVSCASATMCAVIGIVNGVPAAARWTGGGFVDLALPGAPTAVRDVSCPAANWCMVVGMSAAGTWAARWSSGAWTLFAPTGTPEVADIECPTTLRCWGARGPEASVEDAPLIGWAAYYGWGTSPTHGSGYYRLTCAAPDVCLAAVESINGPEQPDVVSALDDDVIPTIELWANWTDFDCASATSCVVLGFEEWRPDPESLQVGLRRWNGTAWLEESATTTGRFHGESSEDIACGPDECFVAAVANRADGNVYHQDRTTALVETDGTSASTVLLRDNFTLAGNPSSLSAHPGLACADGGGCVVATPIRAQNTGTVGVDIARVTAGTPTTTVVDAGTASGTWSARAVVACPPASDSCVVVAGDGTVASAWQWDGTTWARIGGVGAAVPGAAGPPAALTCRTATDCLLVTTPEQATASSGSRIHRFDGTQLSSGTPVAAPAGEVALLSGLDCTASQCLAVGASAPTGTTARRPWAVTVAADATSAPSDLPLVGPGELRDVACTDDGECLAVGSGTRGAPATTGELALGWTGSWIVLGASLPIDDDGPTTWQDVGCGAHHCTIAGTTTVAHARTGLDVARYTWPD